MNEKVEEARNETETSVSRWDADFSPDRSTRAVVTTQHSQVSILMLSEMIWYLMRLESWFPQSPMSVCREFIKRDVVSGNKSVYVRRKRSTATRVEEDVPFLRRWAVWVVETMIQQIELVSDPWVFLSLHHHSTRSPFEEISICPLLSDPFFKFLRFWEREVEREVETLTQNFGIYRWIIHRILYFKNKNGDLCVLWQFQKKREEGRVRENSNWI